MNWAVCQLCITLFESHSDLQTHTDHKLCSYGNKFNSKIVLPPPGSTMTFKKLRNTVSPNLICYADGESILKTLHSLRHKTSYTPLHQHLMVSFGYVIVEGTRGQIKVANIIFGMDAPSRIMKELRGHHSTLDAEWRANTYGLAITVEEKKQQNLTTQKSIYKVFC